MFRYLYLGITWLLLAAVVTQAFLAGLMLFGQPAAAEVHEGVGWILHLVVLLLLFVPALAGAGRTATWLALAVTVAMVAQPYLTFFRGDLPVVAALHPVNALVMFLVLAYLARQSFMLARGKSGPGSLTAGR